MGGSTGLNLRCVYETCPTPTKRVTLGEDGVPRCKWHAYEAASGHPVRPEATGCEAPDCSKLAVYLTHDGGRWCLLHWSAWTKAKRQRNREAGLCACGATPDEGHATCTACRTRNQTRAKRRKAKRAAKRSRRTRVRRDVRPPAGG